MNACTLWGFRFSDIEAWSSSSGLDSYNIGGQGHKRNSESGERVQGE